VDQHLETKLRELIDRQEIWSVLLRYARGLDRMDAELVRSCYHEGAVDDHHVYVGTPEGFLEWVFRTSLRVDQIDHHGLNNHTCELDGDDAYCETYYTFVGSNAVPPHLLSIGRYVDHFQRRSGVWKIANRACVIEKLFELQEMPGGTPPRDGMGIGAPVPATRDRDDVSYHRPVKPRRPLAAGG
jgi:hypothetical protein